MNLLGIGTKRFKDLKGIPVRPGWKKASWIMVGVTAVMTTDSIIKLTQQPSISAVTIPGGLGLKDLSPILLEKISTTRTKLETYHSQELELSKQQEELELELIKKEKLKAKIKAMAPIVVIGVVGAGLYLILRRKK